MHPPPPLQLAGRVKNFRKVFAGGEGSEIFILVEGGVILLGGEGGGGGHVIFNKLNIL